MSVVSAASISESFIEPISSCHCSRAFHSLLGIEATVKSDGLENLTLLVYCGYLSYHSLLSGSDSALPGCSANHRQASCCFRIASAASAWVLYTSTYQGP